MENIHCSAASRMRILADSNIGGKGHGAKCSLGVVGRLTHTVLTHCVTQREDRSVLGPPLFQALTRDVWPAGGSAKVPGPG